MQHPSSNPKASLRRQLQQRRQALSEAQRTAAAAALCAQLQTLPALAQSQHIAVYCAANDEIDPSAVVTMLRRQGKQLYLPVVREDNSLLFAPWAPDDALQANRFGISEPVTDVTLRAADALDALLIPLLGWDRHGTRLGMGGGFYDRSLADSPQVLKIGLAYATQQEASLPREPWDVKLDYVVTEAALVRCGDQTGLFDDHTGLKT
jgi:5-formyltetrahydrofolate cyclo-ligase